MRWWGKATGGTLGLAIFGPVGGVVGLALGHEFDKGMTEELATPRRRASVYPFRETLLDATFSVMGHIAMIAGKISRKEKRVAAAVINDLQLESHRQSTAWRAFETGSRREFKADPQLARLKELAKGRPEILRAFVDMQMRVALADGGMSGNTRVALKQICRQLGISAIEFAQTEAMARMRSGAARARAVVATIDDPVLQACGVLGIEADAEDDVVKQAYRRLMNRHHPDKLAGQDPGEAAMLAAREKTHEIRMAYETVMEARRD